MFKSEQEAANSEQGVANEYRYGDVVKMRVEGSGTPVFATLGSRDEQTGKWVVGYLDKSGKQVVKEMSADELDGAFVEFAARGEQRTEDSEQTSRQTQEQRIDSDAVEQPTENVMGAEDKSTGNINRETNVSQPITDAEINDVISGMEANAIAIPQLELTPENWVREFGEEGQVSTPIGMVKIGENQIAKLFERGRSSQFGMIRPTLESPDIIIEVESHNSDGTEERPTSLIFVKTFTNDKGEKIYYYKSVSVLKDGLEVSISSHIDREQRIRNDLKNGKLLYRANGGAQTEHLPADASVTASHVDAQGNVEGKGSDLPGDGQVFAEENAPAEGGRGEMPVDKDGEPMFVSVPAERSHAFIYEEGDMSRQEANEFVAAKTAKAKKALEKLQSKPPKVGNNWTAYQRAKAQWQEAIKAAEAEVAYWNKVAEIENERRAAARAEAERRAAAESEAERKRLDGLGPVKVARERYQSSPRVEGANDIFVTPDGRQYRGRYILVESGVVTASHDARNGFVQSEGAPRRPDGTTLNDRDYEHDQMAQHYTRDGAKTYDSRALQSPVVVTPDGVVVSGNGRTMMGELAAEAGTDGAYVDYLREMAGRFGFTAEQVAGMQHPRVVFELAEPVEYTTETFARFNATEMKTQGGTEQAVKLGKTVNDAVFGRIVDEIERYGTLEGFYNAQGKGAEVVDILIRGGVINEADRARFEDMDGGLTAQGKEFIEKLLSGKAFANDVETLRKVSAYPKMRRRVAVALRELARNADMRELSLAPEIAEAVALTYDELRGGALPGQPISARVNQGRMLVDVPDSWRDELILGIADLLNSPNQGLLRDFLRNYNERVDTWGGGMQLGLGFEDDVTNIDKRQLALEVLATARRFSIGEGDIEGIDGDTDRRYFIGNKARKEYEALLDKKRPDLSEDMRRDALDYLHSLEDTKENNRKVKIAMHWMGKGKLNLPEDIDIFEKAMALADKEHIDPMAYPSAGDLLLDNIILGKSGREPLSPDGMPGFSFSHTDGATGCAVYDVEDSKVGQQSVVDILLSHCGVNLETGEPVNSPWCLSTFTAQGKPTTSAWHFWSECYNGTSKQMAFKDGKPFAFSATRGKVRGWWDLHDHTEYDSLSECEERPDYFGSDVRVEEFEQGGVKSKVLIDNEGKVAPRFVERTCREGGVNVKEIYHNNGKIKRREEYKDGERHGVWEYYNEDGTLEAVEEYEDGEPYGAWEDYYPSGQLMRRREYKDGVGHGVWKWFYDNGSLMGRREYKDGVEQGVWEDYYPSGQLMSRIEYKDGVEHGVWKWFYDNGSLMERREYKDGILVSERRYSLGGEMNEEGRQYSIRRRKGREDERRGQLSLFDFDDGVFGSDTDGKGADTESRKETRHVEAEASAEMLDAMYADAVGRGDVETAMSLLRRAARERGYDEDEGEGRLGHKAPNSHGENARIYELTENGIYPEDVYSADGLRYYGYEDGYNPYGECAEAMRILRSIKGNPDALVKVYRAVPAGVKAEQLRNGDWVTIVKRYAESHRRIIGGRTKIIEDEVPAKYLWTDGNSLLEQGYDDGKESVYQNTRNNRKYLEITYDEEGNLIPLSKRFDKRKRDKRYLVGDGSRDARDKRRESREDALRRAEEMEREAALRKARIEKLRASEPLVYKGDEYVGKYRLDANSARNWMLNNLRGEYKNAETGDMVIVSRVGPRKATSHNRYDDVHLKSMVYVPDMIERAIFIGEEPNTKEGRDFTSYRYYVVGLQIGGVDYTAKMVFGKKDDICYYDHDLTQIEKGDLIESIGRVPTQSTNDEVADGRKDTRLFSLLQINDEIIRKKIKEATGFERGADGEWRYEGADGVSSEGQETSDYSAGGEIDSEGRRWSLRKKEAPKVTGKGFKVFVLRDGRLYPPMVANPDGADTPVRVWLDADEGVETTPSKTGRRKVKAKGGGSLAYRPGWHLGELPYAYQFNRGETIAHPDGVLNKDGSPRQVRSFFPKDFVWAEVEYSRDVDYQAEADGTTEGDLKYLPVDGSYKYSTMGQRLANPFDTWIISGAVRVNRLLKPSEVDAMVVAAGRKPQEREAGAVTDAEIDALNRGLGMESQEEGRRRWSILGEQGAANLDAFDRESGRVEAAKRMEELAIAREMEKAEDTDSLKKVVLHLFNCIKGERIAGRSVAIAQLTEEGTAALERISGLKFKKNSITFEIVPSDFKHIYENHYGANEKDQGNNIPLTDADIEGIVDVILKPDHVLSLGYDDKHQANVFAFLLDSGSGSYNMVEVYGNANGTFKLKTFYHCKKKAAQRVHELLNEKNLLSTSANASAPLLSGANVPQLFVNAKPFSAKIIKIATGWERGADGKWRYEMPDGDLAERINAVYGFDAQGLSRKREAALLAWYKEQGQKRKAKLWDALMDVEQEMDRKFKRRKTTLRKVLGDSHPIIKAYPSLANTKVSLGYSKTARYRGYYSGGTIYVNGFSRNIAGTLIHEIQHMIQKEEGFSQGGDISNPDYHNLMGEVEARNAQERMNYSDEERRQKLLAETEDVAREDQVFLQNNLGKSLSSDGEMADEGRQYSIGRRSGKKKGNRRVVGDGEICNFAPEEVVDILSDNFNDEVDAQSRKGVIDYLLSTEEGRGVLDRLNHHVGTPWARATTAAVAIRKSLEDLPALESCRERFEKHGGSILPVIEGNKILDAEKLRALPKWTRPYQCPIDNGTKQINNEKEPKKSWNCTKCDRAGGVGCFFGRTAKKIKISEYDIRRDDIIRGSEGVRQRAASGDAEGLLGGVRTLPDTNDGGQYGDLRGRILRALREGELPDAHITPKLLEALDSFVRGYVDGRDVQPDNRTGQGNSSEESGILGREDSDGYRPERGSGIDRQYSIGGRRKKEGREASDESREGDRRRWSILGEQGAANLDAFDRESGRVEAAKRMEELDVARLMEAPRSIEEVKVGILKLFQESVEGPVKGKAIEFGRITDEGRLFLERLSGLTIKKDVSFTLNPSDLVHIHNEHYGENEKEPDRNIPLNDEDIKNIVEIVSRPDHVVYINDKNDRKMFVFLKADEVTGCYNLAEVYTDRRGNLTAKSLYKTKKDVSHRVMALQSQLSTSATSGAILSSANIDNLFDMTKGFSPKAIKMATGWERGADGKWRYELPDGKLRPKVELKAIDRKQLDFDLEEFWDDAALYEAYPELKEVKVHIGSVFSGKGGSYNPQSNIIEIGYGTVEAYEIEETLVHEIQHAIQHIEGFAKGGNLRLGGEMARRVDVLNDAQRELIYRAGQWLESYPNGEGVAKFVRGHHKTYGSWPTTEDESYVERVKQMSDDEVLQEMTRLEEIAGGKKRLSAFEAYERLMGETEARNASRRMGMNEQGRMESLLEETEDVAREDQIFLRENLDDVGRRYSVGSEAAGRMRENVAALRAQTQALMADESQPMADRLEAIYFHQARVHSENRILRDDALERVGHIHESPQRQAD